MRRANGLGLICAVLTFVLDQTTKSVVIAYAGALRGGFEVFPGFNLVFLRNYGVSFGFFNHLDWRVLFALGLGIVAILAVWLWRAQNVMSAPALGLIIGGALGNMLDRARHGGVTDFLDFYVAAHHWPAFNLADMAIVTGTGLILLDSLRSTPEPVAGRE